MKTWNRFGLKPFNSKAKDPRSAYAILSFGNKGPHSLILSEDGRVLAEASFEDALEMAIEAAEASIVWDRVQASTFGPRPAGYPERALAWFLDEESAKSGAEELMKNGTQ